MSRDVATPAEPRERRRGTRGGPARERWRTALRLLVLALFLAFVAVLLARQWGQVRPLLGRLSPAGMAAAAVAVLAGHLGMFLTWRAILGDLGSALPPAAAGRVFFVGQLGKYVPGSIWPAVGWALLAWLAYGAHVWLLARQLGVGGGPSLLLQCTGAFAGAWCVGFLLVVAPAGAGAREAALILLLGPVMPAAQATVVVVVSRLLFTTADLGCAGVAALAARRGASRYPSGGRPGRRAGRWP